MTRPSSSNGTKDVFGSSYLRSRLAELLEFGPRASGNTVALNKTVDYLSQALSDCGWVATIERFGSGAGDCNVIAERPGTDPRVPVLELGAHFDTVDGSPGADDNGSGVVGLIAIARYLSSIAVRRSIRLCFFGQEECNLSGSAAHQRMLDSERRPFAGCIVFEMIGCRNIAPDSQRTPARIPLLMWPPRTGDFICIISNWRSRRLATAIEHAAATRSQPLKTYSIKLLGGVLKDTVRSDHASYWDAGRPAIMLTDTADFRNCHYHQPTDALETIDFEFMGAVAAATAAAAEHWASKPAIIRGDSMIVS